MKYAILLLITCISSVAFAGPASWNDADCSELPFSYPGQGFECSTGLRVPADAHTLYQINRLHDDNYLRITVVDTKGHGYAPSGLSEIKEDFRTVEQWAFDNRRSELYSKMLGGTAGYLLAEEWACVYHHLMRDQRAGGYRYLQVLVYCEVSDKHIPVETADRVIRAVSWP